MPINFLKLRLCSIFFLMGFSSVIYAEKSSDLLTLYNEALRHDAILSAATIQNQATQELIDQGLSLLLPIYLLQEVIQILIMKGNLIRQLVMFFYLVQKQTIRIMNMASW